MTKHAEVIAYEDGERLCPLCQIPLPAHDTWPGARDRYCLGPACKEQLQKTRHFGLFYVEADSRKCDADGCLTFLSEGRYAKNGGKFCTAQCYQSSLDAKTGARLCGCGCGQQLHRLYWKKGGGLVFVSRTHWRTYLIDEYLKSNVGTFRPIVDEYLECFASMHYSKLNYVRSALGPFFRFLSDQEITSLEEITPKVVTRYIASGRHAGRNRPGISLIKTFFVWAIQMGYRHAANPIIGTIHASRRKHTTPRPYSAAEVEFAWSLLKQRGSARVRFVVAIAEEAGLRLGEISRLRVQDIDVSAQRCFVRLPNKTNTERYSLFGVKTKECFAEWMKERNSVCGHDALLHNTLREPCKEQMLTTEMNRTLCKTHRRRVVNEIGFDRWNIHRLRHTMASNLVSGGADMATVMAAGGWKSYESACSYAAPNVQAARRGYNNAMALVKQNRASGRSSRVLSPAELLSHRQAESPKVQRGKEDYASAIALAAEAQL